MPTKILTDKPAAVNKTVNVLVSSTFSTIIEAPYFSQSGVRDDTTAVIDPDDSERELLAGEIFVRTPAHITNETNVDQTITLRLLREDGTSRLLCNAQTINARDTLYVPLQGLLLFKRDLANPTDAGDRLQAQASNAAALGLVFSYSEKEALEHAPNTEV